MKVAAVWFAINLAFIANLAVNAANVRVFCVLCISYRPTLRVFVSKSMRSSSWNRRYFGELFFSSSSYSAYSLETIHESHQFPRPHFRVV
jgi:hypothetical protein